MKIIDEMVLDMDFRMPRVIVCGRQAMVENIKDIVMVSGTAVTANNGERFVTVEGKDFVLREISEGRLVIEGTIQKIEFL